MDDSAIIEIRGLCKRFPIGNKQFTALSEVNLTIEKGEFCGLIGPSGSGKTTLLNIIGSLDVPTEGSAIVLGQSILQLTHFQASQLRNKSLGFIFQTYNLLPVYTVYENVEFPLLLLKTPAAKRRKMVLAALEAVDLADKAKSKPAQLSGGESQRVAIARAMVKDPAIVLADEPTANLDAKNSHRILQTMVKLNRDLNTTFIFASHDEKVIGYLRRQISLDDGKVVSDLKIDTPLHSAALAAKDTRMSK
ncbi:ABC transporter ATP-binding protein [Desulforhopalus sp. IMCC35007]|uniref:ABC transporter ATP-binding protein n=1 Tax=Desulforhopalus sp. IMCC35007 TaxID=2569543 RepID=UPI0010AE8A56|nr:ABC transporter ATP-binding protein [Desulforhopalus sp. IMCC35007]TKB08207.1 ABC transporter ATP-binding protein [Desulforhopalus sp. IMCC35007]